MFSNEPLRASHFTAQAGIGDTYPAMTVIAIMAGLLSILWSSGSGSEVIRPIAVPMVGGMVSSTLQTLLVIPAIYAMAKGWRLPLLAGDAPEPHAASQQPQATK